MLNIQPSKANCFTPKASKKYLELWLKENEIDVSYIVTPRGLLIMIKESEGYTLRDPISKKTTKVDNINELKLVASEMLAISFGWKG